MDPHTPLQRLFVLRKLLADYSDVLSSDDFTASDHKHGVFHDLPTDPCPPVFAKAKRLDPEKLASAKAEFTKTEAAGIIQRSSSPWSSPLHMVKKSDGFWHPGPVETTGDLTQSQFLTDILCPQSLISLPGSWVPRFSHSWT